MATSNRKKKVKVSSTWKCQLKANTIYTKYLGSLVVTVRPKMMSTQTKTTSNQEPIQPDFYLPDGKGSRLSEVHQIKTEEKSPEGHPCCVDNIREFKTKIWNQILPFLD